MPAQLSHSETYLFGGDKPWSPLDWTSSDDCVRGGSSVSHLTCTPCSPIAVFNGNLDIKTLGGAGFASQRTIGENRSLDLSKYDGIELDIKKSDGKTYTIVVKDEILPKSPNGRDQSTISWEFDVKSQGAQSEEGNVFIAWDDLKPTYRGREKKDAEPLDLKNIKRFSIMMRSFFGTQEGDFSLSIVSIAASTKTAKAGSHSGVPFTEPSSDDPNGKEVPMSEKSDNSGGSKHGTRGWLGWLRSCVGS